MEDSEALGSSGQDGIEPSNGRSKDRPKKARRRERIHSCLASLQEEVDDAERTVQKNLHTLDSWRPPTPVQGSRTLMADYEMQVGGSSSSSARPEGSTWSQATTGLLKLIAEDPFNDLRDYEDDQEEPTGGSAVSAAAATAAGSTSKKASHRASASANAAASVSASASSASKTGEDAGHDDLGRPLGAKALFQSGIVQGLIQDRGVLKANLKDYDLALNGALEELGRLRARHSAVAAASQLRRGISELGERLVRVREAQEELQRENLELVAAHEELLDLARSALLDARADEALEGLVEGLAAENEMLWKMIEVSRIVSRISAPPLSLQAPSPGAKRHRPSLGSRSARSSAGSSPASPDAGFAERDRSRFNLPNPALPELMGSTDGAPGSPGSPGGGARTGGGSPGGGLGPGHLCVDEAEMSQDGTFDNANGLFVGSSAQEMPPREPEPELRTPPSPESPELSPEEEDHHHHHHHHHHGGGGGGGGEGGGTGQHHGAHRHHGGHHFDAHSHRFGYGLLQQHAQQQHHQQDRTPEAEPSSLAPPPSVPVFGARGGSAEDAESVTSEDTVIDLAAQPHRRTQLDDGVGVGGGGENKEEKKEEDGISRREEGGATALDTTSEEVPAEVAAEVDGDPLDCGLERSSNANGPTGDGCGMQVRDGGDHTRFDASRTCENDDNDDIGDVVDEDAENVRSRDDGERTL